MSSAVAGPVPAPAQPTSASPNKQQQTGPSSNAFAFPSHHSFPPFYTLQPNLTTQARQLALWSALIRSYCAHERIFRLNLSETGSGEDSTPAARLFHNPRINRRLDLLAARRVVDYMVGAEGDRRAEWVVPRKHASSSASHQNPQLVPEALKNVVWVYWRRPEEWADAIYAWVDGTGQRGSVLTVYELREDDEAGRQEWTGMDEDLLRKCIDVLVRRGKAQVFGAEDGAGVKFF